MYGKKNRLTGKKNRLRWELEGLRGELIRDGAHLDSICYSSEERWD